MSKTDSLHYKLCQEGAKWMKRQRFSGYKYIAVELVSIAAENPDVWGTNGYQSTMIEVKTSRADFFKDKGKYCRTHQEHSVGNFRYYLCPDGVIQPNELPDNWGLLWWDGDQIKDMIIASKIDTFNTGELAILSSIMRREGINPQIFNYRIDKM